MIREIRCIVFSELCLIIFSRKCAVISVTHILTVYFLCCSGLHCSMSSCMSNVCQCVYVYIYVTFWSINIDPEKNNFQWKLVFQPLSARVYVNLLEVIRFFWLSWWLIPLSKWVIAPIISGWTLLIPFTTGVITHLLSGMSHQEHIMLFSSSRNLPKGLPHFLWGPHLPGMFHISKLSKNTRK